MKLFLLLTGANKAFEADLAKSFGPEEALARDVRRHVHSNSRWGAARSATRAATARMTLTGSAGLHVRREAAEGVDLDAAARDLKM